MVSSLVIRVYIVPRPLVGTLLGLGRRKVPVLHRHSLWRRSRCPGGTGGGYKRDGYHEVPVVVLMIINRNLDRSTWANVQDGCESD